MYQNGDPNRAKLLRNELYGDNVSVGACDESRKRFVNVRPVRTPDPNAGPALPANRDFTENELGARVELMLRDAASDLRRIQYTSSSAGYLTQNQYPLHFGLPPDPQPDIAEDDLHFDACVDFPTRSEDGVLRVDWTVNDALGDINLADLYPDPNDPNTFGRPITVYRDGRVRYAGQLFDPIERGAPTARMYTMCGPLLLPTQGGGAMPTPTTPASPVLAGVRFTKAADSAPVRIREIVIDGQLDPSASDCDFNVVVIDVTDPNRPVTIGGLKAATFAQNRRTFIPIPPDPKNPDHFVLPQARETRKYDVRVRATVYRPVDITDFSGLSTPLGIIVSGGLEVEPASSKNICEEIMVALDDDPVGPSPVTVRMSRKAERR
ncbi:MAG TPA: ASPIC/UnbV domain-containing protein [Methylomirabilota bacterium]|nr:ASPIC/UnbV domain-containing protein [Methylomirabilota bacterium]